MLACYFPSRNITVLQRPHLARRWPEVGVPSPATLNPHSGHSAVHRMFSWSLRRPLCLGTLLLTGGLAGVLAEALAGGGFGAAGAVAFIEGGDLFLD